MLINPATFEVDDIRPMRFDDNIFEKVVFDRRKKEFLRTLIECHNQQGHNYDEFIAGKVKSIIQFSKPQLADLLIGQCLLVFLTGESGTGKSLMAECCKFTL